MDKWGAPSGFTFFVVRVLYEIVHVQLKGLFLNLWEVDSFVGVSPVQYGIGGFVSFFHRGLQGDFWGLVGGPISVPVPQISK